MTLQTFFPQDVIKDHKLCSIVVYSLIKALPRKTTRFLNDDIPLTLEPYQVLIVHDTLKSEIGLELEEFYNKLGKLKIIYKVKIENTEKYTTIRYFEMNNHIISNTFLSEQIEGQNLTLSKWLEMDKEQYLNFQSNKHLENTITSFNRFIGIIGDRVIAHLTQLDCIQFVKRLKDEGLKTNSINDYTRSFKASIRRALKEGFLTDDPFEKMKQLPSPKNPPIVWEKDEIYILNENIKDTIWIKTAVEIVLLSGLRRGEIMNLKWQHIDLEDRKLYIKNSTEHKTKFGKERILPIGSDLMSILTGIKKYNQSIGIESEYVICNEKGEKFRDERPQKFIEKIVKENNMKKGLTFHGLRKTFATHLRTKGVKDFVIQNYLGHSDMKTTMRYMGVLDEQLMNGMEQLFLKDFCGL